ncbi:hypothetical protein PILCRDRAFT_826699 [Piloderma croceum F 1598]|uniref:Uncharacterized protein n=1 Tax=Piloderma croceum (strain F 1598) TaxID=765440 RepID=A0A0C3EU52_PILCF|nr:hypothetical protein PILCRDRAFT_826699 [Piloderma croceum F 1598]
MPVANIPLDRAYLTAIWLETLFYGMNIVLFCSYLFISRYRRKQRRMGRAIMTTAIFMFLFSTTHVSLGFQRLIEGFIILRNQPGGPAAFFSDVSIPANVAKVCIHTINSILGDSIVVWRCYHVWGQNLWICALPILMILGSASSGFAQTIFFATAKNTHTAFAKSLAQWNGAVFSLSLATNIMVTSLIAVRVWYLEQQFKNLPGRAAFKYKKVLAVVIESGAIYSSALVIEITLYFLNTNAFYIVYDPIAQLTGIVPTMIIVLTNLGLTTNDLNSTLEANEIGKSSVAFRTVGETTTAHSFYGDRSLHGAGTLVTDSLKPTPDLDNSSPTDSPDTSEFKYNHTVV